MTKKKIILGIILAILGLIGVASMLTMNIPLTPEEEMMLKEQFTDEQIKFFFGKHGKGVLC